jgi:hypothetical protein
MALKQKSKRTLCGALAFFVGGLYSFAFTGKSVFLAEFFTYESLYICIIFLGGIYMISQMPFSVLFMGVPHLRHFSSHKIISFPHWQV